jgi:hypothetical protein
LWFYLTLLMTFLGARKQRRIEVVASRCTSSEVRYL